jgi:GNAT superfamily N-acetyltransferase
MKCLTAKVCTHSLDDQCIHLLAIDESADGQRSVGTLRFFPPPKSKLGRLAVRKSYRSTGAGRALVLGLEQRVRQIWDRTPADERVGRPEIICHSQTRAMGFYAKLAPFSFLFLCPRPAVAVLTLFGS